MERKVFLKDTALALFAAGLGGLPTFIAQAAGTIAYELCCQLTGRVSRTNVPSLFL